MTRRQVREVKLWTPELAWAEAPDGTWTIWRTDPLGPYPERLTEKLVEWAQRAPDRPWLLERAEDGGWAGVTYAQGLDRVRRLAQVLLDHRLSADRPLLILSDNSVDHGVLAVAAQHVGIPSAAVSTAYSLLSQDFGKLRDIAGQITPGLVFADSGSRYGAAIRAVFDPALPLILRRDPLPGRDCLLLDEALTTEPTAAVETAHRAVTPDTVAKFLFTSGTTGSPKAVIQTHRMLCANQAMAADAYAFVRDEPPVIVDWPPWSHVASGSKTFNLALYNGGTFHIDRGKPTPDGLRETIAALREISPTWYFNVPAGYEMLVHAMEDDDRLRESFFARLQIMMYAGAGMAQHTWDRLGALAQTTVGARILLSSALGATETSPFALMCSEAQDSPGNCGIPAQGSVLKLVPDGDKLEARLKGPHITPGYWRNPEMTAAAFDEDGFYKLGDALRFALPGDPRRGFFFDGRIAENFKLQTGTWVGVGALRATLVDQLGGLARDAVIAGENREELGALLLPAWPALRALASRTDGLEDAAVLAPLEDAEVLAHPMVRQALRQRLIAHAKAATGSANRVRRVLLLDRPLSLDRGEITDKGSINQRAVLRHNPDLIERLYSDDPAVLRVSDAEVRA